MKCIKKDNKVVRVENEIAYHKVAKEGWQFICNAEFRKATGKVKTTQPVTEKAAK